MEQIVSFMRKVVSFPIIAYQYLLSPLMQPCCRFYPSCSQYALLAIQHHGVVKGLWLACRRLLKCHPWSEGGFDPILPNKEKP